MLDGVEVVGGETVVSLSLTVVGCPASDSDRAGGDARRRSPSPGVGAGPRAARRDDAAAPRGPRRTACAASAGTRSAPTR